MRKDLEVRVQLLRLDGKTVAEASKITGLPKEEVEGIYYQKKYYQRTIVGSEKTKYQRLDKWIREHGLTRTMFADRCGISVSTMHKILNDEVDFTKQNIDKILKATGLTYEEVFSKGVEE